MHRQLDKFIELAPSDVVEISGVRYKVMKKRGKKPWLKRVWRFADENTR